MSKVEIEWNKDKLSGDMAAQADFVGPKGNAQSVAMRLNAEAMKDGHLAHRFVPYFSKLGNGMLQVKWSKDPASGDLMGQVSFTGPDGKKQTLSARANEALIKAELVKRFAPQLQAVSGNIFGDVVHAVSHAASSIAHAKVVKSIGSAVHDVMNSPITHAIMPATLVNKIAMTTPVGRQVTSKILTSVLGPAAPTLGPTVLKAMGNVVYGAQHGSPKALEYVQQLTQKAAAGDPSANQLATLMNLVKQFPAPAPAPVAAPMHAPMPALPAFLSQALPHAAAPAPKAPAFADYERMLQHAVSGFDGDSTLFAISGATPEVPGMDSAITAAISHIFSNPVSSSVIEGAAKVLFGQGAAAFNAIPSLLAVGSRLLSKAAKNDPGAVAYVARVVEAGSRGDEAAKHFANVLTVLNEPAPSQSAPVNNTPSPIPEALPGVTTPAPSFEYLAAVQQNVAAAAGCAAGDPMMDATSGHFQLDNVVQIPTVEFQQLLQAAGAKMTTDGTWGPRSVAACIEFVKRTEGQDATPALLAAAITPYAEGRVLLVNKSLLENLVKLVRKAAAQAKGAASGAEFVDGNMDAVEQYQIAGALPDVRDEIFTISGAGAPPSEEKLAEDLLSKAAKGDKEALAFMGMIKQRAAAHDQAAVRMQTVLSQASKRLAARVDAAKKAAGQKAQQVQQKVQSVIPTEGGPIAQAFMAGGGGDAVVWSVDDPARGIAVSGLEAYVPPSEKDLRTSATMQYALKVMDQSAQGNAKSKQLIDVLRARHTQGDVSASALLWFLHQAWLMRKVANGAASGGSVAYGTNAWNPSPMNVKNYYQISGRDLGPFYSEPSYPVQGNVVSPDGTVDIIAGAGGRLMKKVWDGRKWTWQYAEQSRPVFAARPGFGMKDAMAAGRQAMQRRQLHA